MKVTIMAVDLVFHFRLAAYPHTSAHPQIWQLDVLTTRDIADVLEALGFVDTETAERLAGSGATLTPQPGLNAIPMTDMAAFTELFNPEAEPPGAEAQEGYMLVVRGETTEERLAAAGFVVRLDRPLQ